jgi:predicted adenylyl cyclase CyaB
MKLKNVEVKAICRNPQRTREILASMHAHYAGCDHQVDTYFHTPHGRLKLRRGNIENALIAYKRTDVNAPKLSEVILYKTSDSEGLAEILCNTLEIIAIVEKKRDIYYIDNVKFHVDEVKGLGSFAEIEAMADAFDEESNLRMQVEKYMQLLEIRPEDLMTHSYSDMIAMPHEA